MDLQAFRRAFAADLLRFLRSRSLWTAVLLTALCLLCGAFSEIYMIFRFEPHETFWGAHDFIAAAALRSGWPVLALPVLSAIPCATAVVQDLQSGYYKQYVPRTGRGPYALSKALSCGLFSGLGVALGILLGWCMILVLVLPMERGREEAELFERFAELLPLVLRYVLFAMLYGELGMAVSVIGRSAYPAYAAPFVLTYLLVILQERYFLKAHFLNPQNYLLGNGGPLIGGVGGLLIIVGCALLLGAGVTAEVIRTLKTGGRVPKTEVRVRPNRPAAAAPRRKAPGPFRQVLAVAALHYRSRFRSFRILLTYVLAFILCFLLSYKSASFALKVQATMQAFEPFIWTFGDSNSIAVISLLLVLLFADIPSLGPEVPFHLARTGRRTWAAGQMLYVLSATLLYLLFIFASTSLICMQNSFIGNKWSETAAILSFSGAGREIALPAVLKTMEYSLPYANTLHVFLLMSLYSCLLSSWMVLLNIRFGRRAGFIGAFGFTAFGLLLSPQTLKTLFDLPVEQNYIANVAVGWLSPLNQATYHMHSFGYDLLPKLWQTYLLFGLGILLLFILSVRAMSRYNFTFTGTENRL